MSPGAEKRLASQIRLLETLIKDQRSVINLESLLVRRIWILVGHRFNRLSYDLVLFAVKYLKATLYGQTCLLSVPPLKVNVVNAFIYCGFLPKTLVKYLKIISNPGD